LSQIYADSNLISGAPYMTGRFPSDIVWVAFHPAAPQSQRQAAVDRIGGEVVGGVYLNPGAIYYVRIRGDGTAQTLFDAIHTLRTLPQVRLASPDVSLLVGGWTAPNLSSESS